MAPTSDRRREVAARLRTDVTEEECIDYAVFRIIYDVLGVGGAWGAKAAGILADLIDPTCHLVETIKNEWPDGSTTYLHRLSCGHMCETIHRSSPVFCPYCGARLTNCGARVIAGGEV